MINNNFEFYWSLDQYYNNLYLQLHLQYQYDYEHKKRKLKQCNFAT